MSDRLYLFEKKSGKAVPAILHRTISEQQLHDIHLDWEPVRIRSLERLRSEGISWPEHWHWDWSVKAGRLKYAIYECMGIECNERMQGLMLLRSVGKACRLPSQVGKAIVYIEYIESAPWNIAQLVPAPEFSGVGTRLIEAAIQYSIDEGFKGRLGLHSLPQSAPFYSRFMQGLGPDSAMHGLRYFEMTPEAAEAFLNGE